MIHENAVCLFVATACKEGWLEVQPARRVRSRVETTVAYSVSATNCQSFGSSYKINEGILNSRSTYTPRTGAPMHVFTCSQCPTHIPLIYFQTCAYIAAFETSNILTVSSRHCAGARECAAPRSEQRALPTYTITKNEPSACTFIIVI